MTEPAIDPAYLALIHSDRVSERTRQVLLKRAEPPVTAHTVLTEAGWTTLRAVVDRLIPQAGPERIDLVTRIIADLDAGGDGWRFTDLPPDAYACPAGLRTLAEVARAEGEPFTALDGPKQDSLLGRAAAGKLGAAHETRPGYLSAGQMKLWFEDLLSAAARLYVAHPATLARIGYSGIANGGDGPRKQGFVRVGRADPEPWEPVAATDSPR